MLLRVTTGKEAYADSTMKPKIVVIGSKGTYTGKFNTGNRKGKVMTTTRYPDGDIGAVQKVTISSKNGNGWYFTKIEIKSGDLDWQEVGCSNQWLDGKLDDEPYGGSGVYSTSIDLHPVSEHCDADVPAEWGTKTKSGCFCKGAGKSQGICASYGSSYTWCRTMNNCKGHGKEYGKGRWDKCTPGPKDNQ